LPHLKGKMMSLTRSRVARLPLHNKFYDPFMGCGDDDDPDGRRAWQAFRLWQHIARYG
jgi:hypothetical protein